MSRGGKKKKEEAPPCSLSKEKASVRLRSSSGVGNRKEKKKAKGRKKVEPSKGEIRSCGKRREITNEEGERFRGGRKEGNVLLIGKKGGKGIALG